MVQPTRWCHFCCYCVDEDFGPFFIKFCTYFPYNAKLCLNGTNGRSVRGQGPASASRHSTTVLRPVQNPHALQRSVTVSTGEFDALVRKWFASPAAPIHVR